MSFGSSIAVASTASSIVKTDIAPRQTSITVWSWPWNEIEARVSETPMRISAKTSMK